VKVWLGWVCWGETFKRFLPHAPSSNRQSRQVYTPELMPRDSPRPHPELKIRYSKSPEAAAQDADALVLITEWPAFAVLDLQDLAQRMSRAILIDGRNLFDPESARQAGFDYSGIGRPQRATGNNGGVPREPHPWRLGRRLSRAPPFAAARRSSVSGLNASPSSAIVRPFRMYNFS
jgi:UDP-glucose/GDP-mannose dehydrogenase family, UDP binding domain